MKKREKSSSSKGMGKEKPVMEEKGKKIYHRIRIGMDFNPKTLKLHNQEVVDKYLAKYSFQLNSVIKIEFCPHGVDVS